MRYSDWKIDEFNGYLHSLRNSCNILGFDKFCLEYDCDLSRIQRLYNSDLHGSNYVLSMIWSDDFQKEYDNLIEINKTKFHRGQKLQENAKILEKQLAKAKKSYCGLDLYKVKCFLYEKSKENHLAWILKLCLEIEDRSISAKSLKQPQRDWKYQEKQRLIQELIDVCKENNINYGFLDSDVPAMKSIILFDLPCGQISWHCNSNKDESQIYSGQWDGQECSTLEKLEKFIVNEYSVELNLQ